MTTKICKDCGESVVNPYPGILHHCRRCKDIKQIARDKNEKTRLYQRDYLLRRRYGITLEEYNMILDKQEGRCSCCGKTKSARAKTNFHVEHDHARTRALEKEGVEHTQAVRLSIRGITCSMCNRGLSYFRDSQVAIEGALRHLAAGYVFDT